MRRNFISFEVRVRQILRSRLDEDQRFVALQELVDETAYQILADRRRRWWSRTFPVRYWLGRAWHWMRRGRGRSAGRVMFRFKADARAFSTSLKDVHLNTRRLWP